MISAKGFAFKIVQNLENFRKIEVFVSQNLSKTLVTFVIPTTVEN